MKPTICIIDDSELTRELLAYTILNEFDVNITQFQSYESAKNEIHAVNPCIVVLDYNLSLNNKKNKNGDFALSEIKNLTSVIILSGQNDKAKSVEFLLNGAVDYISKNDEEFLSKILNSIESVLEINNYKQLEKMEEVKISMSAAKAITGIELAILILSITYFFNS